MFAFIEGILIEKTPTYAIVNCSGVGYMIHISLNTYTKIKEQSQCRLLTHLAIKEDAHTLYGFYDEEERSLFRNLISVSGVGANTARMMLSSLSPNEIIQAIVSNNSSTLQSIKGIGNKTAQRIVLDLKDKINKTSVGKEIFIFEHNTKKEEALSALVMLGFNKTIVDRTLNKIISSEPSDITVEQLIKIALKNL